MQSEDLTAWIARLYEHPGFLAMGHNQRAPDLNLGLGWFYYALGRFVHPRRAVVIGSYRGFVPLLFGKAFRDNAEPGEVAFVDPSMVDDFWKNPEATRAHFGSFGLDNVRHFLMTTQVFVETADYRAMGEIGILFVDGYHTAEQARFDFRAFEGKLAPRGFALFHDSLVARRSGIYGPGRDYEMRVKDFVDELKQNPGFQVLDVPYGTGITLVRKLCDPPTEPLLEGREARP